MTHRKPFQRNGDFLLLRQGDADSPHCSCGTGNAQTLLASLLSTIPFHCNSSSCRHGFPDDDWVSKRREVPPLCKAVDQAETYSPSITFAAGHSMPCARDTAQIGTLAGTQQYQVIYGAVRATTEAKPPVPSQNTVDINSFQHLESPCSGGPLPT